jgi:DNA-binding NarL/FixJ family response regulator
MENTTCWENPREIRKAEKIRVMLVDDHSLMRDSLRAHLESKDDIEVVAEAGDGEEAVSLAAKLTPEVIIMDIAMPRLNGIEATRKIKARNPDVSVLVLTVHNDSEYILKILEAGADGYLTKDIHGEKLVQAIRFVTSGESVLSEDVMNKLLKHALRYPIRPANQPTGTKLSCREVEILGLAARGMGNKQIAQELDLNLRTVKGHFVNIFSKLNANSRTEAVIIGLKTGLLVPEDIGLDI